MVASPDGRYVLLAGWFGAQLFRLGDGVSTGPRIRHSNRITCAAFSEDGGRLITGSSDGTTRIWSVPDGNPLGQPLQHNGEVWDVAFVGNDLLVAQGDGLIRVWKTGSDALSSVRFAITTAARYDHSLLNGDGHTVVSGAKRDVTLFDAEPGDLNAQSLTLDGDLHSCCFVDGGSQLLMVLQETIMLWEPHSGEITSKITTPSTAYAAASSPDGLRAVVLCSNQGLLIDGRSGNLLGSFTHPGKPDLVNTFPRARFSGNGSHFVTYSAWNSACVWNSSTLQQIGPSLEHSGGVSDANFSPDGSILATAGVDRIVQLWKLPEGKLLAKLCLHSDWVFGASFSRDGNRLLTACRMGQLVFGIGHRAA